MLNLYDNFDDTRAQNGIGSQLNVFDETLGKYVILIPLETVPSIVGSTNTVDVDLLTSKVITKIRGKQTIDDKDTEFLWHKDNIYRLSQYVGKQCKFLASYPDGTGIMFEGTIDFKPDDATSDKLTGTVTIVANKLITEPIYDVRPLMAKTCFITSNVPNDVEIKIAKESANATALIDLVSSVAGATFTAVSDTSTITCKVDVATAEKPAKLTITATATCTGVVKITASSVGNGSWTTLVTVIAEKLA